MNGLPNIKYVTTNDIGCNNCIYKNLSGLEPPCDKCEYGNGSHSNFQYDQKNYPKEVIEMAQENIELQQIIVQLKQEISTWPL